MLHGFLSKFRVENDARNENFKKTTPKRDIIVFRVRKFKRPAHQKTKLLVSSLTRNVAFSLKNSSNVLFVVICSFN